MRGMSQPAPPSTVAPYPELVAVHQAATAGNWVGVCDAYAALSTTVLRAAAARLVGDVAGSQAMLTPVAQQPGDSPERILARTMLASSLIVTGWSIRSGLRAQYVSGDQFRQFHDYLRQAEQVLIGVIAQQPDNVAAWNLRMTTARGLELGQSEARRRYDHAARYEPHYPAPQAQLVQQLCPKWGGTFEQAHAFARECVQAAPPGSVNGSLVVEAHLEHWAALSGAEQSAYLRAPAVQQEISFVAGQSLLNPAFRPVYGWVVAHGYFALFHSLAGNLPAAAVHFRAVEGFDPSSVWGYYVNDVESTFQRHRAAALARG